MEHVTGSREHREKAPGTDPACSITGFMFNRCTGTGLALQLLLTKPLSLEQSPQGSGDCPALDTAKVCWDRVLGHPVWVMLCLVQPGIL